MAAIDKIYATQTQREEFRTWCFQNKPSALRYFYDWDSHSWDDGADHPITNFPEHIDLWLLDNCPLTWVTDRIKAQYGMTGGNTP